MNREQLAATFDVLENLLTLVTLRGSQGLPAGEMYARLMPSGITLETLQALMQILKDAGRVRESNHCYYIIERNDQSCLPTSK